MVNYTVSVCVSVRERVNEQMDRFKGCVLLG